MAAGDVTITRGIGYRDDALVASNWATLVGNAGVTTVGSVTFTVTSDGDLLHVNAVIAGYTFGTGHVYLEAYTTATNIGPLSNTTYPSVAARAKGSVSAGGSATGTTLFVLPETGGGGGGFGTTRITVLSSTQFDGNLRYGSGTSSDNNMTGIDIIWDNITVNGTYDFFVDFGMIFKETLTLPAVSSPLTLSLSRYVIELPIPTREGGILQDLGSASGQLEIDGTLITTTSPNNYTGDQWWDVLVGTWLEANWQWLTSDRVSYKYQIESLTPTQEPGKVGYYGFKMKLRKVDILTASAQTFGSVAGSGAIQ